MTFTKSLLAGSALCAATLTANAAAVQLITDGNFETGPITNGWNNFRTNDVIAGDWYAPQYNDRYNWKTTGGNSGNTNDRYLGQSTNNPGGTDAEKASGFYQLIENPSTAVAGSYTLSFDYLNTDGGNDAANLISWAVWGFNDGDISADGTADLLQYGNVGDTMSVQANIGSTYLLASGSFAPGTVGWTGFTASTFAETTGFDTIVVGIGVDEMRAASGDLVGFDNVSLTFVPEPSSLAILGLGGLCMLKRRRRNA